MELFNKKNTLIILAATLVVAFGYMAMKLAERARYKTPATPSYESQLQQIESQSESDEVEAIEADLERTETDNLDAELQDIEVEFDGAL